MSLSCMLTISSVFPGTLVCFCVLPGSLLAVRNDMEREGRERGWIVTDEGDKWSVELDVRDLGGHLDTTFRVWSAALATRVRMVISRLILNFVLPLDFHGRLRLRVIRSTVIGALHGIEASVLPDASLRELRTAPTVSLLPILVQFLVC